jgi:hypothetical protein
MTNKYGVSGKLKLSQEEGDDEPWYRIIDLPQGDVKVHNGEMFSLNVHNRWQDVYVDYGANPPQIRRFHSGRVIDLDDGQYQARQWLGD